MKVPVLSFSALRRVTVVYLTVVDCTCLCTLLRYWLMRAGTGSVLLQLTMRFGASQPSASLVCSCLSSTTHSADILRALVLILCFGTQVFSYGPLPPLGVVSSG